MSPISIDPTLTDVEVARAIHIHQPSDTNHLRHGDVVESWDFTFRWDEDCKPADELEEWRRIPDPIVDDYLSTLPPELISPQHDQLHILFEQSKSSNPQAKALMDHLTAEPPEGVRCSNETMRDAQECFYRFAGGILLGTFYISLVGGFSSPRITSVLHQTSYLVAPIVKKSTLGATSPSSSPTDSPQATSEYMPTDDQINNVAYAPITAAVKQRTSVRLLETLQFVLDIMGSPLASAQNIARVQSVSDPVKTSVMVEDTVRVGPGCMKPLVGEGWRSTVRVRLLHGVVRKRIMSTVGKEREKGFDGTGRKVGYDFDQDGYPLNAEDMLLTLASFCVAPLWACQRIGSPIPPHLEAAYIAHWRHVGYYLGVPSDILARHMSVTLHPTKTDKDPLAAPNKIFASCLTHLFAHPKDLEDTQRLPPPTLPLLHTAADMPPFVTPIKSHFRAARFFLGDSLATALNIPRTTAFERLKLRGYFLGVTLPEQFGRFYWRRSWDVQRKHLTQDLLGRMVRFKLSGRRTMFRPHKVVPGQLTKQEPDLPDDVVDLEKKNIVSDKRGAMKSYIKYQALMIEMVIVALGVVGLGAWGGWKAMNRLMALS